MEDIKDIIRKRGCEIEEEIFYFHKEKQKELENFCINNGGHYFFPFYKELRHYVDRSLGYCHVDVRICSCCGFTEERNV